mgnify:CR=1 FL=1
MRLSLIALVLLVVGCIGTVLASNNIQVKSNLELDLGELTPLQNFDTGVVWYNEVITTDVPCNVTVHLDTSTLSQEEIDALGNPWLNFWIRNHSTGAIYGGIGANLSIWAPPCNYTWLFTISPGVYDIGIYLFGKTGKPANKTIIDFKVVVELNPITP